MAYAAIGMSHDLGFNDRVFGLAFGIFFAGYVILQIPCAILVERWSARKMICLTMVAWGAMTGLTALVRTPNQLYLARLLLGAAEAGFFPGVVVYLSRWFLREDRAKATSNFMAAIPLSFVIGSPIAGWILGHSWSGMPGWRWLFFVEGLPAVVLGIVAYFFLTDSPGEARWLKAEQRDWIARTLEKQKPQGESSATVWDAFRSRRALLLAGIAFLNYSVFYTFIFWLPTMLKRQSGLADLKGRSAFIRHKSSGLQFKMTEHKSQAQNKERAWALLRATLYEQEQAKQHAQLTGARKAMMGSGDRSQRIRTYNFPQNR